MNEEAIKHEKPNYLLNLLQDAREAAGEPLWLLQMRRKAARRFLELGIPTVRDEDWKYSNFASVVDVPFQPSSVVRSLSRQPPDRHSCADLNCARSVFVNRRYYEN